MTAPTGTEMPWEVSSATIEARAAVYCEPELPSHGDNPYILALPPILTDAECAVCLSRMHPYNSEIRSAPPQLRTQAMWEARNFHVALEDDLRLYRHVSELLRCGYLYRNPLDPRYAAMIARARLLGAQGHSFETESEPLALLVTGPTGTGKSRRRKRVLDLFDQLIVHSQFHGRPLHCHQVVYLKLVCPQNGSVKNLMQQIFIDLDALLPGHKFYQRYARGGRNSAADMFPGLTTATMVAGVGAIFVDELQNISEAASGGAAETLNFFDRLTNVGVPVILIGTPKVQDQFADRARSTRRGSVRGQLVSGPLACPPTQATMDPPGAEPDSEWAVFCRALWRYQYTNIATPYAPELAAELFRLSQGFVGPAVTIYFLAQRHVIGGQDERLTKNVMRSAVQHELPDLTELLEKYRDGAAHGAYVANDLGKPPSRSVLPDAREESLDTARADGTVAHTRGADRGAELDAQGASHAPGRAPPRLRRAPRPGGASSISGDEAGRVRAPTESTPAMPAGYDAIAAAGLIRPLGGSA
jgi:hypothetical protein